MTTENDVHTVLVEQPTPNVKYVGVSLSTSNPALSAWRIYRELVVGEQTLRQYANFGKYVHVWNDRATYFDPPPPGSEDSAPIGDVRAFLPAIANLYLTTGAPLGHTFASHTKRFSIFNTANTSLKLGFKPTLTEYLTVPPGAVYSDGEIGVEELTIYLKTESSSHRVEIVSWS